MPQDSARFPHSGLAAPLLELRDLAHRQKYGEAIDLLQRIERGLRSKLPAA